MRNFTQRCNFWYSGKLLRAPEEISSLFNGQVKVSSDNVAVGPFGNQLIRDGGGLVLKAKPALRGVSKKSIENRV